MVAALLACGCSPPEAAQPPLLEKSCSELQSEVGFGREANGWSFSWNWSCGYETGPYAPCRDYACARVTTGADWASQCPEVHIVRLPALGQDHLFRSGYQVLPTHPLAEACLSEEERASLFGWVVWEE
jgi:hypothetical protein